jgi:hypothetical protein
VAAEVCLLELIARAPGLKAQGVARSNRYAQKIDNPPSDPLYQYAIKYWPFHAQLANELRSVGRLESLLRLFVEDTTLSSPFALWQKVNLNGRHWRFGSEADRRLYIAAEGPLYLACVFDFWEVVEKLLQERLAQGRDQSIIQKEVLPLAARYGSIRSIDILLEAIECDLDDRALEEAASSRHNGVKTVALFLDKAGNRVRVTEKVVALAAGNSHDGHDILDLLFYDPRNITLITYEALMAAARNTCGGKSMALFLDVCNNDVEITDEVVQATAKNPKGYETFELLRKTMSISSGSYTQRPCSSHRKRRQSKAFKSST